LGRRIGNQKYPGKLVIPLTGIQGIGMELGPCILVKADPCCSVGSKAVIKRLATIVRLDIKE
jgi:hypothetical protein